MKKINLFIPILMGVLLTFFSCGKDDGTDPEKEPELPAWNKANTVSVYFISKPDGGTLFNSESEYVPVINYLKGKSNFKMAVLDRCDVVYSSGNYQNPSVSIALQTNRIPVFARNHFNGDALEGSGILLDQIISTQEEVNVDSECYIKTIGYNLFSSNTLKVASVRLNKETQIAGFIGKITQSLKEGVVLTGTIQKSLYPILETQFKAAGAAYRLAKPDDTIATYCVFVLSSKSLVTRDMAIEKIGNLNAHHIQVELLK